MFDVKRAVNSKVSGFHLVVELLALALALLFRFRISIALESTLPHSYCKKRVSIARSSIAMLEPLTLRLKSL